MKIIIRIVLLILIAFSNTVLAVGCWDMREINEIGLVTAVGIDKAEGPYKYSVTVQIANQTTESSSESSQGTVRNQAWTGTGEGESLFDATRKLVDISSRRIMWAHNNVIVIGEDLAKESIIPVVDFFTHNPELRMKTAVVVAQGKAKDYITARVGMEKPSGVSFILMEGYRALTAQSIESHMLQVSASLKGQYSNPLISRITLKKSLLLSGEESGSGKGSGPGTGSGSGQASETIEMSGAAVFKKDKMLGWLSPEETLGVAWILDQTQDTVVTVKDPEHNNGSVSVETRDIKVKTKSYVTGGTPEISIFVTGSGHIVEEDASTGVAINRMKENLEGLIDKKIKSQITNSLEVVQKRFGVDCLDFSAIVHSQHDREWEGGLKKGWQQVFPQIPVSVDVKISIRNSTMNQEPMQLY